MIKNTNGPAILSRLFSLDGRNAIVTGATSGIGHMIASALVQAGAKVYVVARKRVASLSPTDFAVQNLSYTYSSMRPGLRGGHHSLNIRIQPGTKYWRST